MKNPSKLLTAILAGSLAMGALGASVGSVMADGNHYYGRQIANLQVRSVNDGILTLVDGATYKLPYGFDASKLSPGAQVSIVWTKSATYGPRVIANISVI